MENETVKYIFKELPTPNNMRFAFTSYMLVHHDEGGYKDNEIDLYCYKDGEISMSDNHESFVYFDKEQIAHLQKFLDMIKS